GSECSADHQNLSSKSILCSWVGRKRAAATERIRSRNIVTNEPLRLCDSSCDACRVNKDAGAFSPSEGRIEQGATDGSFLCPSKRQVDHRAIANSARRRRSFSQADP